jgi:hypothetical protein
MASRTHSNRCRVRIAARTWVESVRCVPRALIHPRALQAARTGLEEPLASYMREQAAAKIVQQGEVEARAVQVEAEGILPIHAAADRIGRLAVGQPFDILQHHDQG